LTFSKNEYLVMYHSRVFDFLRLAKNQPFRPYQYQAGKSFEKKHPIPAGMLKSQYPPITG